MKRARGTGSITPHRGRFWARLPVEGKIVSLGVHDTEAEAEVVLNLALRARGQKPGASATVLSFATFGRKVLDIREEEGIRGIKGERRRFAKHLEQCAFASKAVHDVTTADVSDLVRALSKKMAADKQRARKLSKKTVARCISLVRAIFEFAVHERKLMPTNPCDGVKVRGSKDENVDGDGDTVWDWLRGDEQQAFLRCERIPRWFRVLVRFAWGTGLRQGEQWNLELRDVHLARTSNPIVCSCGTKACVKLREQGPHLFVRYGSKGLPPKNGKTRTTPLFGEGLAAATEWLDTALAAYAPKNPLGLMFPTTRGCRRQPSPPQRSGPRVNGRNVTKIYLLPEALKAAGIDRAIRWHDLRHTCASSLVSGSWGRAWPLVKVRDMLGHSSVTVTEKYAHLCRNSLRDEAESTPGHQVTAHVTGQVTGNGPGGDAVAAIRNDLNEVPRDGIEPPTRGFSIPDSLEELRAVTPDRNLSVAARLLELASAGRGAEALALAVTLAGAMVNSETNTKVRTG